MEYFLLKPHTGGYKLKQVNQDPDILICKAVKQGDMPDFTLHPVPLISDRFKVLLEQYLPAMEFVPCLLEGEGKADFWQPKLKVLGVEQAEYWPDGTVKAVPCLGLQPIVSIPNYKKVSYVVNLMLAESLLRRGYVNLELERIETLGGEAVWQ